MSVDYTDIVAHYEQCFLTHGDNHQGVDWPNPQDLDLRFRVAYESTLRGPRENYSLLDFGCGNGLFLDYLAKNNLIQNISYTGMDISSIFIDCCQKKYPNQTFVCADILKAPDSIANHDFIIMNGVLTEKCNLTFGAMWEYAQQLLTAVFQKCNVGISFNVMSGHVDWKRDDLFHLDFDLLAAFIQKHLSRNYVFRNDYGLYEYTAYVYR